MDQARRRVRRVLQEVNTGDTIVGMVVGRRVRLKKFPAAVLVAIVALATGWPEAAAVAQEAPTPEQMLVERFAPVLMLKQQKESCGDGEPYEPVAVDVVLNNPEVALRQIG